MTIIKNYKYIQSYKETEPIIPTEDGCCTEICAMLHETIDGMEKERDYIESMQGLMTLPRGFVKRLHDINKSFLPVLENMSYTLTDEGICKCVKKVPEKYE
jgi:hypothetical protein